MSGAELSNGRRFVREPGTLSGPQAEVLARVRERLLAAEGGAICRLILFGSRARGDAGPDSDYDILVLVRGLDARSRLELRAHLYRAVEDLGVVVEPWIMAVNEFEETKTIVGGFAHQAWKEGIVLHPNA